MRKSLKPMISSNILALFILCHNLCPVIPTGSQANDDAVGTQVYIIQLRHPPNITVDGYTNLERWYRSFLPSTPGGSGSTRLVYQYSEAIIGFAAKLTEAEVNEIAKKEGFLKAYPDRMLSLFTTHTPTFLGLEERNGFWKGSNYGKGVIIGVLDSGIAPDHPSFSDKGMPPPPPKWKGACMFKKPGCNKKIIGARSLDIATEAPIDKEGHGTHTASTAAGNFVSNAAVLGNGNGTAVGMAPRAHLAIYKVCGPFECASSRVLAGMDAAIKDGVDILSLSLGARIHYYGADVIAIGAFSAMEKGILVSCSAGNDGPSPQTLSNDAPWILTVGASTMDRSIRVTVKLGDGRELEGESVFQPANVASEMLPLVHPTGTGNPFQTNCVRMGNITGKIAVCRWSQDIPRVRIGSLVKNAGGAGMILVNTEVGGYTTLADAHVLPASHISYNDGEKIKTYLKSSGKPTATLEFKGTIIGNTSAPAVASFSSRGPSVASPRILKPDIIGPGVSVLAAWPFPVGSSHQASKPAPYNFNIISGTSMSTPHLSGIAALVKSMHPDWSPAAIKSAIMTTSDITRHDGEPIKDEQRRPASHFMMGAGHVNPQKASDPGLVYDLSADDYIGFLCGLGYKDADVEAVTRHDVNCSSIKKIDESDLNYPSITASVGSGEITVNRTVTHVGETGAKYTVEVAMPKGVEVSVVPRTLEFSKTNEKRNFAVKLKRTGKGDDNVEGQLKWVSDKYVVRSPIVIVS